MTPSPESTVSIAEKFQAFYEQFVAFSQDAAELHSGLTVRDDASRAAFNALSRVLAFTDQLNLLVSLMREDVRVLEDLTSDPVRASWTEEIEPCFYDWLKAARGASTNVH